MTVKGSFMFEIEFYALPDGRKPVEEFLDSLPVKMRVKALDSLDLLEEYGNQLRMPYSKALSDGIFELRIRFSGDISRIFYFCRALMQMPSFIILAVLSWFFKFS